MTDRPPDATGPPGSDIFAAQPGDPALLAAIYDLEHDAVSDDFGFYRELARRARGSVVDLGCGSGRLFRPLIDGGARLLRGIDGSPALLRRAHERIARDPVLRAAAAEGRIRIELGDVRRPLPRGRHRLVVVAGVLPHLAGPEDAVRMLGHVGERLEADGRAVIDDIGPAGLPWRDLPLSLDWEGALEGRRVVRRSQLTRRETPAGLQVDYRTVTDAGLPDGTIARLPASYRLWYPSEAGLERLLDEVGMVVEVAYGSYDLDPLDAESERRIVVAKRRR